MQYRSVFGNNSKEERNLKTQAKWLKAGQKYCQPYEIAYAILRPFKTASLVPIYNEMHMVNTVLIKCVVSNLLHLWLIFIYRVIFN